MRHTVVRFIICAILAVVCIVTGIRGIWVSALICGALAAAYGFSAFRLLKKGGK